MEKWKAPFDNGKTRAKTLWLSKDLWVRRIFKPDATEFNTNLKLQHDDNVKKYISIVPVFAIAMLIYQCI